MNAHRPPGTPRHTPDGRLYVEHVVDGQPPLWLPHPCRHGDPVYRDGALVGTLAAALGGWAIQRGGPVQG